MEELPVDVGHWLLAVAPLVVLLVFLAGLRWGAPEAAPVGLLVGVVTAVLFFETPFDTLFVAVGKGIWDSIPILLVVWPALLLYRIGTAAGAFHSLRKGIARYSKDETFLVLAFGWVFASFLQGVSGFGTPVAVAAPLLVAIGVKPVYAVAIPLIGHAWANMFGTLGVGWLATLQVVSIEDETMTAYQTSILLWIPNLLGGLAIAWFVGRGQAVRHALPFVAVITVIHGGGQLAFSFFSPVLCTFIAAALALIALYPLSRWKRYREGIELDERPAMKQGDQDDSDQDDSDQDTDDEETSEQADAEDELEPVMGLGWALAPYAVLTVASVTVLGIGPLEEALSKVDVGLPFPEVTTGYDITNEAEDSYEPLAILTHPATFLVVAAVAALIMYRARGYFRTWGEQADRDPVLRATATDAVPASLAIVSFLVLAKVLDHSGQTDVLALGLSAVAPAIVFAGLSNVIGVLGAFMTSSNTASNVLFAPLQDTVAAEEGLSQSGVIAAQSAGGAIGNAVAPANIVLGTSTAGAGGREGEVLRKTLPWTAGAAVLTGIATIPMT